MINVSKPYMPPLEEFNRYLEGIWKRSYVTNNGPLLIELEYRLKEFLGVNFVQVVSSGTMALQIALRSLDLKGEIITTAFSHVSTVNAVLWNNCTPVFVDIENKYFCIDPSGIEAAITKNTCAILATHVYGYPCQVKKIQAIGDKYNVKVIFDGAQAFGVDVHGRSVFNYGDVTAVSFHATKIYHTIEGGAIVTNNKEIAEKSAQLRNFGLLGTDPYLAGINGKNSEIHAAIGLCNLPKVPDFICKREQLSNLYRMLLKGLPLQILEPPHDTEYNFAYFPVLFHSQLTMLAVYQALANAGVHSRRYFYPSLNRLPYLEGTNCPVSEDVCQRVMCLPLYYDLLPEDVREITQIVSQQLQACTASQRA